MPAADPPAKLRQSPAGNVTLQKAQIAFFLNASIGPVGHMVGKQTNQQASIASNWDEVLPEIQRDPLKALKALIAFFILSKVPLDIIQGVF